MLAAIFSDLEFELAAWDAFGDRFDDSENDPAAACREAFETLAGSTPASSSVSPR